jgi:hypothetical protein
MRHLSLYCVCCGCSYPDTYKRRGQARSAMGDTKGALEDLAAAAKLLEAVDQSPYAEALKAQGDDRNTAADCYLGRSTLFEVACHPKTVGLVNWAACPVLGQLSVALA